MPAVLLVEDDDTIGRHLTAGLRAAGYTTRWCRTGTAALIDATQNPPDIALLDLGLPDLDGLDLTRDLRQRHPDLLIVILTARGDDIDVVAGLDLGADDYLVKPVGLHVLLARLRAHRRKPPPDHPAATPDQPITPNPLTVGLLTIDPDTHRCHLHTTEIALRPKEFDLLTHLAAHPGSAVRREDLMSAVWDEHWSGSTKTLDVTMAALRQRLDHTADTLGLTPTQRPTITTLRGHGYRLELGAEP